MFQTYFLLPDASRSSVALPLQVPDSERILIKMPAWMNVDNRRELAGDMPASACTIPAVLRPELQQVQGRTQTDKITSNARISLNDNLPACACSAERLFRLSFSIDISKKP